MYVYVCICMSVGVSEEVFIKTIFLFLFLGQGAIGDPCVQDSDCSTNIPNTACLSGTCQCVTSLYIYDIAILGCRLRLIDDPCTSDANCGNYMHG